MASDLYWIDAPGSPRLAIMARPRAGDWLEDEIAHWRRSGVELVVCLLEREEVEELGLDQEADLCAQAGIEFLSFPIPDRGVPDEIAAIAFAEMVAIGGKTVAIHCRAGIGRSSIMAAAVLLSRDVSASEALHMIETARGLKIPDTEEQRAWVLELEKR